MRKLKIKKGDLVLVITGKDRGRKGKVLRAFPREGKVLVEGLNLVKKHQKPRREGEKGQVVEVPRPIDVSNVKLICSKCGQPTRAGYGFSEEGKKYRICKKCNQAV